RSITGSGHSRQEPARLASAARAVSAHNCGHTGRKRRAVPRAKDNRMNAPHIPVTDSRLSPRIAKVERKTAETSISVEVNLDGAGRAALATGVPFLDHMLDQVARH